MLQYVHFIFYHKFIIVLYLQGLMIVSMFQVKQILKKAENERTEDEIQTLEDLIEIVQELQKRAKRREKVKAQQQEVLYCTWMITSWDNEYFYAALKSL